MRIGRSQMNRWQFASHTPPLFVNVNSATCAYVRVQHQTGRVQGMCGITGWKPNSTKFQLRCQEKQSLHGDLLSHGRPAHVLKGTSENLIAWVISNQSGQTYRLLGAILPWCDCGLSDHRDLFHWWLPLILKIFGWIPQGIVVTAQRSLRAPTPTTEQGG